VLARDGDRDMLGAGKFIVGWIEAPPTGAGDVNLRPGVGRAMLAFAHHAVDIAQPAHLGFRLDLEERTLDMDIVSLARPQQCLVGTERDGRAVVIFGFMSYADALHKWGGEPSLDEGRGESEKYSGAEIPIDT